MAGRLAKAESPGAYASRTAISGAANFVMSAANGAFDNPSIGPVPVDFALAVAAHGAAFAMQMTSKGQEMYVASPSEGMRAIPGVVHSVADGLLHSFVSKLGMGVGVSLKKSMSSTKGEVIVGNYGGKYGQMVGALTPSEAQIYAR
jgi:hypothetical protein